MPRTIDLEKLRALVAELDEASDDLSDALQEVDFSDYHERVENAVDAAESRISNAIIRLKKAVR